MGQKLDQRQRAFQRRRRARSPAASVRCKREHRRAAAGTARLDDDRERARYGEDDCSRVASLLRAWPPSTCTKGQAKFRHRRDNIAILARPDFPALLQGRRSRIRWMRPGLAASIMTRSPRKNGFHDAVGDEKDRCARVAPEFQKFIVQAVAGDLVKRTRRVHPSGGYAAARSARGQWQRAGAGRLTIARGSDPSARRCP